MKNRVLLVIIAVLLLIFCGCTQKITDGTASQGGQITFGEETSQTPTGEDDRQEETALPVLHTAIADGTNENRFESVHHVGDYGYEQNLIWCERIIENVTVIPIESADADTWYTDGTVVCAFDKLLPGEAIKLDIMVPEGFPSHAISYYADGVRYVCAIGYNGRDGGISFVEIDVIEKPETDTHPEEGFTAVIHSIRDENGGVHVTVEEVTIESSSAWHVWAALKEKNSDVIPRTAYLNSFSTEGNTGRLDLAEGIYNANLGSMFEAYMLDAIADTYLKTYNLEKLYLTVDGELYESGHIVIDEPFELPQ